MQEKNETAQETAASSDYFTQTRLERDTMYSQMLETYQKILENEKISSDQKQISSEEIKNKKYGCQRENQPVRGHSLSQ